MSDFDSQLYGSHRRERKSLPRRAKRNIAPVERTEPRAGSQQTPGLEERLDALVLDALGEPAPESSLSIAATSPGSTNEKSPESRPKRALPSNRSPSSADTSSSSFVFGYDSTPAFSFTALSAALDEVGGESHPVTPEAAINTYDASQASTSFQAIEEDPDDLYIPPEVTGPLTQDELDAIDALNLLIASYPPLPSRRTFPQTTSAPQALDDAILRYAAEFSATVAVQSPHPLPADPDFHDVTLAAQSWKPGMISPLFSRPTEERPKQKISYRVHPKDTMAWQEEDELAWVDDDSDEDIEDATEFRQEGKSFADLLKEAERAYTSLKLTDAGEDSDGASQTPEVERRITLPVSNLRGS